MKVKRVGNTTNMLARIICRYPGLTEIDVQLLTKTNCELLVRRNKV